jgi:hypothetical protein
MHATLEEAKAAYDDWGGRANAGDDTLMGALCVHFPWFRRFAKGSDVSDAPAALALVRFQAGILAEVVMCGDTDWSTDDEEDDTND